MGRFDRTAWARVILPPKLNSLPFHPSNLLTNRSISGDHATIGRCPRWRGRPRSLAQGSIALELLVICAWTILSPTLIASLWGAEWELKAVELAEQELKLDTE
ncbi:hypothetical protein QJS10_CPB04g01318 [Acorus calamus]|uniref:Uncharacterized protein n=1 Tax=Acorus calamus TaxID=4465 RepID=A0AAV9F183_ACOCL|nr:hypothetical protein QJS10_CPB04g01318 [Acorus calamus]